MKAYLRFVEPYELEGLTFEPTEYRSIAYNGTMPTTPIEVNDMTMYIAVATSIAFCIFILCCYKCLREGDE